jgi:hypothetical protein
MLASLAGDGRNDEGGLGSITLRRIDAETVSIRLQRDWSVLAKTAQLRRSAASLLLDHLCSCLPAAARGADQLAETTLGRLLAAIDADLLLKSEVRETSRLLDRALLWLHEQEVIRLNKGLAVFRPAMTIRLDADWKRQFRQPDFAPLKLHYDEQVVQIHVMAEYVQRGLQAMADAVRLTLRLFPPAPGRIHAALVARPRAGTLAADDAAVVAPDRRGARQPGTAGDRRRRSRERQRAGPRRPRLGQDARPRAPHRLPGSRCAARTPAASWRWPTTATPRRRFASASAI